MNKITIEYRGRNYFVTICSNPWDKKDWDCIVSFPKEEGVPDPDEFLAFLDYLENEGFAEKALKTLESSGSIRISYP